MTASFSPPPRPSLSRQDVLAYLAELRDRGWDVYENGGEFIVKINEMDEVVVSPSESGVCRISSRSATGITSSGAAASNMLQFEQLMSRFGGAPSATHVTLRRGEPVTNLQKIARLIDKAKVEAVHDPYLDNQGLVRLVSLCKLGKAADRNLRLMTGKKGARGVTRDLASLVFRELGCPGGEIRQTSDSKAHRRFMLLSGGKSLHIGLSLNDPDKNESASGHDDAEDRAFFESEWKTATPLPPVP